MAKKTPIEKLDLEIKKILEEYQDDIKDSLDEATRAAGKQGTRQLKSLSSTTFGTVPGQTKKYAKSWAVQFEQGRFTTEATIYNRKPGLPHLLEFGHDGFALRGGGRSPDVPGRKHIADVEEKLVKEFEDAVRRSI